MVRILNLTGRFASISTLLAVCVAAQAATIISGPGFTKAPNAPLAGRLTLTTDEDSRVTVRVDDGTNAWERCFFNYARTHSLPLLGLKAGRTNWVTVSVSDKSRQTTTAAEPLMIVTDPLPSAFPVSRLLTSQPERMEPGYTLFRIQNRNGLRSWLTVVDQAGEVVWYSGVSSPADVRQLENGNLFIPRASSFVEINMLGETVRTLTAPTAYPVNIHDGVITSRGTILYLSDASTTLTDFPTSTTNPNAPRQTTKVQFNQVVEISADNAGVIKVWSLLDMLDPRRLTYLTFGFSSTMGLDIQHANAVIEDPRDDSLIVSLRQQNAVIKFSKATGQLKWILGPHENWGPEFQQYLLTPVGTPFAWCYAQHAPMITPQGTLLLFDNGNYRATPFDPYTTDANNYSRAVEYSINEETMEIFQVWDSTNPQDDRLFTPIIGKAQWLPQRQNVLINYGYVTFQNGLPPNSFSTNATMVRIREVTYDLVPEVVFDLSFFNYSSTNSGYVGNFVYRSQRIPDLYPHPAVAVADLTVTWQSGTPLLEFSGDETRSYEVQASSDMANWETLGMALPTEVTGQFEFWDSSAVDVPVRYYRVLTQ